MQKADIVYGDDDDDDSASSSAPKRHLHRALSSVRVSVQTPIVSPAVLGSEIEIPTAVSPVRLDLNAGIREEVVTSETSMTTAAAKRSRCSKAPTLSDNSDDDEFSLALYDTLG